MITGSEISWPITRGGHRPLGLLAGDVRREAELARTPPGCRATVWPRSEPATRAPYTGAGSRLRARSLGDGDGLEPGVLLPGVLELHEQQLPWMGTPGSKPGERALGARRDRRAGQQV